MTLVLRRVESSNVVAVGYVTELRQLFVQYKDSAYRYDAVPPNVYLDLLQAESIGKFLHSRVRLKFPYTKLDRLIAALPVQVAESISLQEDVRGDSQ